METPFVACYFDTATQSIRLRFDRYLPELLVSEMMKIHDYHVGRPVTKMLALQIENEMVSLLRHEACCGRLYPTPALLLTRFNVSSISWGTHTSGWCWEVPGWRNPFSDHNGQF